jgi:GNAT superfamily N-acetyltransferase
MKIQLDILHPNSKASDKFAPVFEECREICKEITRTENKFDNTLAQIFYPCNIDYLVTATQAASTELVAAMAVNITPVTKEISMAYIAATCVDPRYQRCGISSAMFNFFEQHAKNIKHFQSYIHKENTSSQKSRMKMGFELTESSVIGDEFFTARKPVNPEVAQKTLADVISQVIEVKEPLKQKAHDEREPL